MNRLFVTIAFLVAVAGTFLYLNSESRVDLEQPKLGRVFVDPTALDFGSVWEDPEFQVILPVENLGARPTTVQMVASCSCTAIEPAKFDLEPGQRVAVKLKLDLSHSFTNAEEPSRTVLELSDNPGELDAWKADFSEQIRANVGAPESGEVLTWTIQGHVQRAISVHPHQVLFSDSIVHSQSPPQRTIQVRAHASLNRLEVSGDSRLAKWNVNPNPRDAGLFEVVVEPHPNLEVGPFKFSLSIYPITEDDKRLPAIKVPVSGQVNPDIQATPSLLSFGSHRVGATRAQDLTLRSSSGSDFVVDEMTCDDPSVSIDVQEETLSSKRFTVHQVIANPGNHLHTIRIEIRRANQTKPIELLVRTSYLGLASQ